VWLGKWSRLRLEKVKSIINQSVNNFGGHTALSPPYIFIYILDKTGCGYVIIAPNLKQIGVVLMHGIFQLPWWGYALVALAFSQITILGVTIYLHRCQAHRALDLHPIVSHFFRFWLWLTTGMVTKEWAAIHRKHHAKVETTEDPHSPMTRGIKTVLLQGTELYRKEARNLETLERYGQGTPDDWVERNVYTRFGKTGVLSMLAINIILFGPLGLTIWAVQMMWIPIFAAGVINGIGHFMGYRNFETQDASRNISPIAFFIGGEELHNNHHTYATSAKFSVKWWELDIGWVVIRTLQLFGLAKPKRVPPREHLTQGKSAVDVDTLKAIFTNRFHVMARYSKRVILPVLREERRRSEVAGQDMLRRARTLLIREPFLINDKNQQQLAAVLTQSRPLNVVYQFRLKLQEIWAKSAATQKELVESLEDWCRQAEATGIEALKDFVKQLKAYVPHPGR
jgi:stearoyl-CoA desaturase (delta-9 desaturase)